MPDPALRMTVNGRRRTVVREPHARLLDVLRDGLHLTGAKEGCGAGECGTCSVFVNGVLVKSCLMPAAKAEGAEVVTVEGLDPAGLTALQSAFHKTGASQCGYCIPGMVMAATATLRRNPDAGLEEIKEGLGGNICRCTGYQKIFEAVELARDVLNGRLPQAALEADETPPPSYIGANVPRIDAPGKVSGRLRYAGDMTMPDMLHMAVLRSPVPHARIAELDASAALAMDGVEAVLTCDDVPGVDNFGVFIEDQPVLARGVVRHVGEGVAAVVAESELVARQALRRIRVRYEPLPAVFDPEEAMRPGAPTLHAAFPDNVCKHTRIRKGDVEAGFAQADLILEESFRTQPVEHAYLEPEAGLAFLEADGTVTVMSPSQNITHHRHMLARILGRPINKVRMVMSPVGGGFGGKEDMLYQGMLAIAAIRTGRPVRCVFTREESFLASAKRHPFRIRYRMGLRRDGRITATGMRMIADGGAYAMSSPGVMNKASILGPGPYAIENVRVDSIAVYTNNTPSGAFRSFGAMQAMFATECMLDRAAERLGMDPLELRRINAMRAGALTHTRQTLGSVSLLRTIDAAAEAARWQPGPPGRGQTRADLDGSGLRRPCALGARLATKTPPNPARKRGRGVACGWYGIARTATIDRAGAFVEIDDGGTAKVMTGVTEIGEGILTVLCQIAAEEIGIRPQDVTLGDNDTARVPEAAHAGATRQTYMIGNAVALAAREARGRLVRELAAHWRVDAETIEARAGEIWVRGTNLRMTMAEAVEFCKKERGVVLVGSASFTSPHTPLHPEDGSGTPWMAYVFGTQIAEVEVDTETGEVQTLGVWAAHDVGRAVNPRGVEGQIEGGVVMALGQALMEDFILKDGRTATPGFAKYILPTALDAPQVTSIIIEDPDPHSPLGAKGIGEPAMVPTAPAILNAIHDAVGVRLAALPATPERVLEALQRKRAAGLPAAAE